MAAFAEADPSDVVAVNEECVPAAEPEGAAVLLLGCSVGAPLAKEPPDSAQTPAPAMPTCMPPLSPLLVVVVVVNVADG